MAYPGGKAGAGVYQRIINQIPPHDVYIEPFLGDGAVLRRKRPASVSIGVDADCRVLRERWNAVTVPGLRLHCCDGTEWLKHRFDLYRFDTSSDSESGDADRDGGSSDGGSSDEISRYPDSESRDPGSRQAALVTESGGGRSTVATSGDPAGTANIFGGGVLPPSPVAESGGSCRQPGGDVRSGGGCRQSSDVYDAESSVRRPTFFVYCDPPYPLPTRRSNRPIYDHEMTVEQHENLLRVLARLPAFVMVSSYWSELYAGALKGWRLMSFEATTRGGSTATEWLWMNYPEPDALHDYRFLGNDKRQRERIRRKVTNWTEGLDRLPELERNAIIQSIASRRKKEDSLKFPQIHVGTFRAESNDSDSTSISSRHSSISAGL